MEGSNPSEICPRKNARGYPVYLHSDELAWDDDERLQMLSEEDFDSKMAWKNYQPWSKTWDHDHCIFCDIKFISEESELINGIFDDRSQTAAYVMESGKRWVCRECFVSFSRAFRFVVLPRLSPEAASIKIVDASDEDS